MTVANEKRIPKGIAKRLRGNSIVLEERLVFGSSGAVTQSYGAKYSGMTVTIVGSTDGRYTIQVYTGYKRLLASNLTLIGPDSSALTTAAGNLAVLRDNDIGEGANDGTITLQLCRSDTMADADPTSGNELLLQLELETGNA